MWLAWQLRFLQPFRKQWKRVSPQSPDTGTPAVGLGGCAGRHILTFSQAAVSVCLVGQIARTASSPTKKLLGEEQSGLRFCVRVTTSDKDSRGHIQDGHKTAYGKCSMASVKVGSQSFGLSERWPVVRSLSIGAGRAARTCRTGETQPIS